MNQTIEKVKTIIERDELNSKTRKQEIVYKRAYLMHVLRCQHMTFYKIGDLFNLDHSTAVYQCKMVDRYLNEIKDPVYINLIQEYLEEFEDIKHIKVEYNLAEDVLQCRNLHDIKIIKKRIRENKYDIDATLLE
jgi:hypothetical protein